MTNATAAAAALIALYPELSVERAEALAVVSLEDMAEDYCERHKDAYGIKARWVLGRDYTREEWVGMYLSLERACEAEFARMDAADEAFRARIASLGLTEWAERNGIRTELDLMDYNYRTGAEC